MIKWYREYNKCYSKCLKERHTGSDGCAGLVGGHLWYVGEEGVEVLRYIGGVKRGIPCSKFYFQSRARDIFLFHDTENATTTIWQLNAKTTIWSMWDYMTSDS